MNYLVRVEVFERVSDLLNNRPRESLGKRLVISSTHELLKVATLHGLHNDAVHIVTCELLFKAHYVGTVFAPRLQFDFSHDSLFSPFFVNATSNHFYGEIIASAPMLCEHYLTVCSLA